MVLVLVSEIAGLGLGLLVLVLVSEILVLVLVSGCVVLVLVLVLVSDGLVLTTTLVTGISKANNESSIEASLFAALARDASVLTAAALSRAAYVIQGLASPTTAGSG